VGSGMQVGERLRAIRRQKGLSLHDVEARSGMEFKASVLGAYERGERAISVPRLLRLADIYEVPSDQLLPRLLDADIDLDAEQDVPSIDLMSRGFTIDLQRLHELDEPESTILSRYATSIQLERQDFNGRLLTIRRDDLRVLAAVFGRTVEELGRRFVQLGLVADVKR
jgi:transcriptional regulator with XRE-family HTH domain